MCKFEDNCKVHYANLLKSRAIYSSWLQNYLYFLKLNKLFFESLKQERRQLCFCVVLVGEDRWICTLMMKSGWTLRYSCHGYNTTFCPEDTEEFMKQRRRWLLSDFANTVIVAGNLCKFFFACAQVLSTYIFLWRIGQ